MIVYAVQDGTSYPTYSLGEIEGIFENYEDAVGFAAEYEGNGDDWRYDIEEYRNLIRNKMGNWCEITEHILK